MKPSSALLSHFAGSNWNNMEKEYEKNNWLKVEKTYKKCPDCNIGEFSYRIQRPGYVKLFFGDKVRRYQCDNCGRKAYFKSKV